MPLQLAYMEEKDIPEFAAVDAATAEGWAFVQAMDLSGQPRHVFAEQWARSVWGKSDMEHWLKVTDTESGEMVAMALWRLQLEEEMPKEELPAPAETVAPETKGESNAVDPRTARFWADTARAGKAFQDEFIGTRPHACECKSGIFDPVSHVNRRSTDTDYTSTTPKKGRRKHVGEMGL